MCIAEELRSLEDLLVKQREQEALMCANMFGNIKSKNKEKIEEKLYKATYQELEHFKSDAASDEMCLDKSQMNLHQIKAIRCAATELDLKVTVKDERGNGVLIITKP